MSVQLESLLNLKGAMIGIELAERVLKDRAEITVLDRQRCFDA
jgi:hypothetical protein